MQLRERRLNRIGTGVILSLIVGGLVFAAARAEGFKASKVRLHDSGIWLTKGNVIGRYNHDLGVVDTQSPTFEKSGLDLQQSDSTVVITTPDPPAMHRFDVALNTVVGAVKGTQIPADAVVSIGGENGGLLDVKAGRVWFTTGDALPSVKTGVDTAFATVDGAEQLVVGTDGVGHVYAPKSGRIWTLAKIIQGQPSAPSTPGSAAATTSTTEGAAAAVAPVEIAPKVVAAAVGNFLMTAAGNRAVLLDTGNHRVVLDDGTTFVVDGVDAKSKLQQPGADHEHLLISTESSLLLVDLHSHAVKVLGKDGVPDTSGTGTPIEPVWLNGCAYGAWGTHVVRYCTNHSLDQVAKPPTTPQEPLRFRTNRGLVALNYKSGAVLDMSDDGPLSFRNDNWDSALKPQTDVQNSAQATQQTDAVNTCAFDQTQANRPPVPVADRFGVRRDVPTILDVLSGVGSNGSPDSDPDCDVLTVDLEASLDQSQGKLPDDGGTIAIINSGRALQYEPPADGKAPAQITFNYLLSDGRADPVSTAVTLNVVEVGDNTGPKPTDDASSVAQGKSVQVNVLANDFDPDGDPLVVTDATILDSTGAAVGVDGPDGDSLIWQANGRLSYKAPAGLTKTEKISYTVSDGRDSATATVQIAVIPGGGGQNKPPNTTNDAVIGLAGNNLTIDVVANDSDPNNDDLRVTRVVPIDSTPDIAKFGDRFITLDQPSAQAYNFAYEVDDGHGGTAWGRVRFTVLKPGANHSPVAVRDDAVVKQGRATLVDVLANDGDLDGNVLMVTAITPRTNAAGVLSSDALSVEVLDHRVLRITTKSAASPGDSYKFQYRVTDGQADALAVVTIQIAAASVGQAPVTSPDTARVHLGGVVGIPVLANDYDPDGDPITIVPGSAVITGATTGTATQGQLFIEGDLVVYAAPTPAEQALVFTVNAQYKVTDGQHLVTQPIVIHVTSPTDNAAPAPADLSVRVFTDQTGVEIPLPRFGLDPDGDPVEVLQQVPDPSRSPKGLVRFDRVKQVFRYDALGEPGQDKFQFEVRDSPAAGESKIGTITVHVVVATRSDNAPPVAVDDVFEAQAGQTTALAVLANDTDPDGDHIVFAKGHNLDDPPAAAGTVAITDSTHVSFTAAGPVGSTANFNYYIVDDAGNGPVVGTVHVTIVSQLSNKPPVAKDDPQTAHQTGEQWVVDVLANDRDPEGDPLQIQCPDNSAAFCQVVPRLPDGTDRPGLKVTMGTTSLSFTYLLSDAAHPDEARGASRAVVQVPLTAADSDRAPTCLPLTVPIGPGDPPQTTVSLDLASLCSDPDAGDQASLYRETQPAATVHPEAITSTLKWNDGQPSFTFTRDPAFTGKVAIDFVVQDKSAKQTKGQVLLSITGHVNSAPVTKPLQRTIVAGDQPIAIDVKQLAVSDKDPGDLDLLRFGGGASPDGALLTSSMSSLGVLTVQAPSITSVSDATGPKSLTIAYTVSDTHAGGDATGDVIITIVPSNKPGPNAVDDVMGVVKQGATGTVNVLANDLSGDPTDPQLSPLQVVTLDVDATGTNGLAGHVHIDPAGLAVFTPVPGFHGSAVFSYTVQDHRLLATKEGHANVSLDVQDKPDRPAQPAVGDPQAAAADVTFASTPDNGSPITSYAISWAGGSKDCGAAAGHCIITGLKNGTQYHFQVTATNAVGTSDPSAPSESYTPDQVPDQPPQPIADWGDQQVTLSWGTINNPGTPLVGIRIEMSPADQPPITVGNVTSHVFNGLRNGTPYTFTITAINSAKPSGESQTSSPSIAVTPAGNPVFAGTPTLAKGDGNVVASWQTAQANGDSAGLTYTVHLFNGTTEEQNSGPMTATSKTLPATNGQTYQVVVEVNNKYTARTGVPVMSSKSLPVRPAGNPKPPASIAVTQNQDGAVKIHIGATNNNGDPLDYYTVSSSGGGSQQFAGIDPTGAATDVVYTGLTNGTSYTFTVTAHNLDGDSLPTGPTTPGVPFGVPAVPTAECHHNGSFITCTWSYGNLNGPTPAAHTVTIDGVAQSDTGQWTSASLPYSTTRTLVVTVCNAGTNGPNGLANPCNSVTKSDTTNPPPAPFVTCSNPTSTTIHCSWGVNGLVASDPHTSTVLLNGGSYSNNDSGVYDASGYSLSSTIQLTFCNSSNQCQTVADGRTTIAQPVPRVVTTRDTRTTANCTGPTCYFAYINVSGFSPGAHTFRCFDGLAVKGNTYYGTINVDPAGNGGGFSTFNTPPYCAGATSNDIAIQVDAGGPNWINDSGVW